MPTLPPEPRPAWSVPVAPGRLVATQALETIFYSADAALDILDRQSGGKGLFFTDQQKIAAARTVFCGIQLALKGLLEEKA